MTEQMADCPDCKGEGVLHGIGCPGFKRVTIPCLFCKGEKRVLESVATARSKENAERAKKQKEALDRIRGPLRKSKA